MEQRSPRVGTCVCVSEVRTATSPAGVPRVDLTAEEIAGRLEGHGVEKLLFVVPLCERSLNVETWLLSSESAVVVIRAPFTITSATLRLWLQCDVEVVTPISVLALPATAVGLGVDAAHAFVGLAVRSGGFHDAELVGDPPLS